MKFRYLKILPSVLLLFACSQADVTKKEVPELKKGIVEQEIKGSPVSTDAWVNLMPNSENRFFISGEIIINPALNYDLSSLSLDRVEIFQNGTMIFNIVPLVQEKSSDSSSRDLIYSTIKGITLNKDFDSDSKVDAELIFTSGSDKLKFRINDIEVVKAR
ncbi:MAG: hypothetical protein D6830_07570 [Ignavibacteria bacterium]|nr:MAG: hypothetical protein D6830_07570 [Ignavibacteria bacterium]